MVIKLLVVLTKPAFILFWILFSFISSAANTSFVVINQVNNESNEVNYNMLGSASKSWKLCVLFPHVKDSYWLAVNYGVVMQSRASLVNMQLYQAGGYQNLDVQLKQIDQCVAEENDAILLGAISAEGLNAKIEQVRRQGIHVIDLVNGVTSTSVSAKSLVSFEEMGKRSAESILATTSTQNHHVNIAWFPGPKGANWVIDGDRGFSKVLSKNNMSIVHVAYGDTGFKTQLELINRALDETSLNVLAGTAVSAEVGVKLLKQRKLNTSIQVFSYYMTPGVFRQIKRGQIVSSPTDYPVIQGRIAVDQAIRLLENERVMKHVGPKINLIHQKNVNDVNRNNILAPSGYRIVYTVNQ